MAKKKKSAFKIVDKTKPKDKISRESLVPPIRKMCFGFSHVTENNNFGLKGFSGTDKKADAYEDLLYKLKDWSSINAYDARMRGKKLGLERIPYAQLSKPMQSICDNTNIVSKDSTVCVFQFYNHLYRLICKEDINHSNLMHIIAFDLDFSAYNHG